jgi:hypothetical protein
MDEMITKDLAEKRFNALGGYARSRAAAYARRELAWYSNQDETALVVLLFNASF